MGRHLSTVAEHREASLTIIKAVQEAAKSVANTLKAQGYEPTRNELGSIADRANVEDEFLDTLLQQFDYNRED